MLRSTSIFARIIFLHVIAAVAVFIAMLLALFWLLGAATDRLHHEALREQAEAISHWIVVGPDGRMALDLPESLRDLYSSAYGRYRYAVVGQDGRVLFSSRNDVEPIFTPAAHAADELRQEQREEGTISGVSVPKQLGGRSVWIQVAENLTHRDVIIDDVVRDFFKQVGWIALPILFILLAIDIVIFRRALRPLVQASERARSINPNRTDVRLPTQGMPSEVRPLVSAINQALDRLAAGYQRQREFTADAAHELRTPLAILRTRLDTIGSDPQLIKSVRQDVEGMCRTVDQLLESAELDTFVIDPSERADLHEICTEVVAFVAPLALSQGKDIALEGTAEPVWITGSAEMIYRAVRNLVENALNHTPAGTTVEVALSGDGIVTVSDRGPGIREAEREFLFRRFWRRDRRQAGGAGLGLSIVQRIADAHAAEISVDNNSNGGARFSLRFPAGGASVQQRTADGATGTAD